MHGSATRVRLIGSDESLASSCRPLSEHAGSGGFFQSSAWLDNFRRHGAPPGDRLRLYAVQASDDSLLAFVPAIYSRLYDVHPRARVLHFLQPDGLNYQPLLAPGDENPLRAVEQVLQTLFQDPRAYDVLRFSPVGRESPFADGLIALLRSNGHPLQIYRFPDDCFAPTTPGSSNVYFAARPAPLRQSLALAESTLRESGRVKFRLMRLPEEVDAGWRDYQQILDRSGADPPAESAGYLTGIMHAAAASGALRLGFIDLDGAPAAVQLWIASAAAARCLRVFSIEQPPEVPLTDLLIQDLAAFLIDHDDIAELGFGALDPQLAMNWAPGRRVRVGLAAFNPRTWRGVKGAARHVGAQFIKSLFGRS